MEITYRTADINDLNEICNLIDSAMAVMAEQNIFQWDDLYPTREDFRSDIEKEQLFVGLTENRIAVVYVLNQECEEAYQNGKWTYNDEPYYVVHRLCVHPIFQNRGIARNALLHMEEYVKSVGVHAIRLDVFSENPFSLKLYQHLGYVKTGCADWRKGRFYLMEKHF